MDYRGISQVSGGLLQLIKAGLVPELIAKPDLIGLCTPGERGDYQLGIYLYAVKQSQKFRISGRQNVELYKQKFPPTVLDLCYMITPYFKSDLKFRAEQEQVVLGRVIQLINDSSVLFAQSEFPVRLSLYSADIDELSKLWSRSGVMPTSVLVNAEGVVIESAKEASVKRVTEFLVDTDMK